ncbi:hypothetical protein V6N13_096451 [Hibiscus sabdariffa]|uniref:Uncharacterized protein n=1 Tax=Hibiscus sabdariffa TaxID=183260 RepID=A0ABR2DHB9_9ROSI
MDTGSRVHGHGDLRLGLFSGFCSKILPSPSTILVDSKEVINFQSVGLRHLPMKSVLAFEVSPSLARPVVTKIACALSCDSRCSRPSIVILIPLGGFDHRHAHEICLFSEIASEAKFFVL